MGEGLVAIMGLEFFTGAGVTIVCFFFLEAAVVLFASLEFVSSECLEVTVVIFACLELAVVFVGSPEVPVP